MVVKSLGISSPSLLKYDVHGSSSSDYQQFKQYLVHRHIQHFMHHLLRIINQPIE